MKKILCSVLSLFLAAYVCGCEFYKEIENFSASEIVSVVESQTEVVNEDSPIGEISYEDLFDYDTYYDSGYTALNDKQRKIYEKLYLIALQMPEGYVRLCENYDSFYADTVLAYNAMINDHPDFFWMPYTYIIGEIADVNGSYVCIAFQIDEEEKQNEYLVDKQSREQMKQQFDAKIEEIVLRSEEFKSQYQKEKFFNDYLCDNTEYDENAPLCQTAYGCLISGRALCEGYSRAFKLLCNQVGIKCDLIYGKSDGENHMWNCVNIGGQYNHVDVTWNDGGQDFRYIYFNMTDKQMEEDRYVYPHFLNVPEGSIGNGDIINFVNYQCDYKENSYYAKNGLILNGENAEEIAKRIEEQSHSGVYSIQLLVDNEDILNRIIANQISDLGDIQKKLNGIVIEEYSLVRDILTLFFTDN